MTVSGLVVPGEGKAGNYYGIPTANIDASPAGLDPGVYCGLATIEGTAVPCILSYGSKLEAHLIDWNGDLYGRTLTVEVGERVSEFVPFHGEEQMKRKILEDVAKAKYVLRHHPASGQS